MTEDGITPASQQSRKPNPSTVGQQKPLSSRLLHRSLASHAELSAIGAMEIVGSGETVGVPVGSGVVVGAGETVGSIGSGGIPMQHIKKTPSMAANGN